MSASAPSPAARFPSWMPGVLLFALTLASYWPALRGGLVWDDAAHLTRPDLQSWAGLGRIWTDPAATQQYYPVLHSAFWLEHRLWGDATLGYHLLNVLLHATSACLFALTLHRLWPRPGPPAGAEWIAAFLFALHPVAVESVAWISEQKNTLSLFFYLLAALAYLDFDAHRRGRTYALALIFFLLALATKSVTATLPAALLVGLWWKNGALRWRRDFVPLLPWFAAAIAAGLFTAWVERTLIGADGGAFDLSALQRLLLAGRIVWFYLGKLFWPADLVFIYPHWDVATAASGWFGYLAGAIAITVVAWFFRPQNRGPLAAWFFFAGSLFPALGFFNVYPFLFSYVADHFQYLASPGIFALVAAGLSRARAKLTGPRRHAGDAAIVLLVITLAALSRAQSGIYRDSETLYRVTLERNPDCWMAHNNLGAELAKSPALVPEALAHYRTALQLRPDYPEGHNNLGNTLAHLPGGTPEALEHFERALQLAPRFLEARLNLANTLAGIPGRLPDAFAQYQQALALAPADPESHYCFANALATVPDRSNEARAEYERTLQLQPGYAEAHANLATLLARQPGDGPAALAEYEIALRLEPALAKTHYNFAALLETMPGRETDAVQHYEEALRLDPDYAEAHNNLAILDARAGNFAAARVHWEAALKIKPDYADARRNLELLDRMKSR